MAQETGTNACIAQAESLAIDAHRAVLQWPHNIFRGVHQAHHVAPVLPALAIGGGDENLEGGIARPGTHAGETGVDAHRAGLRRDDRVCDAEREIVMRMHPALRFGLEDPIVSRSEEHTSELQSLMRISYAVFCLKKKT